MSPLERSSGQAPGERISASAGLVSWIKEDLREIWDDVKPVNRNLKRLHVYLGEDRHGHLTEPFLTYYTALSCCLLVPIILGSVIAKAFAKDLADLACLPSGEFAIPGTISIWSIDFIVSLTVGYGHFSFAQAKAIDICWDLVVGRVGQLFLTWIAFRVFTRAIVYAMESDGVTCATYAVATFEPASVRCTWTVLSDFVRGRAPRSGYGRATYVVMILTGIYIAMFPTLTSAITSYGPVSQALVRVANVTAPISDWRSCSYIIRDGSRLGIANDTLVTSNPGWAGDATEYTYTNGSTFFSAANISYCTYAGHNHWPS